MSKKGNEQIIIDGGIVDRIINLAEKGLNENTKREDAKLMKMKHEREFITTQLSRVEERMKDTDVLDDSYRELILVYDSLCDVVRFF